MQGTDDTLFTLHEAITNYDALKANGVPVQMLWFCGSLTDNPGVAHGQCLTPEGARSSAHPALRAALARPLPQKRHIGRHRPRIHVDLRHRDRAHHARHIRPLRALRSPPRVREPCRWSPAIRQARTSSPAGPSTPSTSRCRAPSAGTELLGEPTLTLNYSGTASNPDDRLYAQILSNANGLVLGNQVTPIPVTLDGQAHSLTIPMEAVAADAGPGSTYTLQITDGTTVYFAARNAGPSTSRISRSASRPSPPARLAWSPASRRPVTRAPRPRCSRARRRRAELPAARSARYLWA